MSNLLPLLFVAPLPAIAVHLAQQGRNDQALWVWIAFVPALWLAINFFSLFQNRRIQREMMGKLFANRTDQPIRRFFVGFARPKRRVAIHTHEDVGFLLMYPDKLEYFGDRFRYVIERPSIRRIAFGANINTLLGLGRWILIEAEVDSKRIRLQIEPRERGTMIGNLLFSSKMCKELKDWVGSAR